MAGRHRCGGAAMTGKRQTFTAADRRRIQDMHHYMDRMTVHAVLTAKHLDLPPQDAIPVLIATAFKLAENTQCMPLTIRRVGLFMRQKGFVTEEEWGSWQQ
jgi:hypothetical protein